MTIRPGHRNDGEPAPPVPASAVPDRTRTTSGRRPARTPPRMTRTSRARPTRPRPGSVTPSPKGAPMGHRYHHPEPTADLTTVPAAPPLVGLRQPRIAVVGGSLTGPVLALLLLQAGLDNVAVYEASPDIAAATGGVLSLEHTALDVLDRLGIPQHEYVKFGFETITQIRGYGPADDRRTQRQYPGRFTTWTLLHHALASRLPAGVVHHGRRVTAMTAELGAPVLHFADGQRRSADLVAFADGRSSIGRRLLDPGRRLHYAGYVAHRGTAPPARLPAPGALPRRAVQHRPGTRRQRLDLLPQRHRRAVHRLVRCPTAAAGLRPAAARQPRRATAGRHPRRRAPAGPPGRPGPRHRHPDGGASDGHRPTPPHGMAGGRRTCGAARRRPRTGPGAHRPRLQQRHRTGRRTRRRPAPAPQARRRPDRRPARMATPAPAHRDRRGAAGTDHRRPTRPRHPPRRSTSGPAAHGRPQPIHGAGAGPTRHRHRPGPCPHRAGGKPRWAASSTRSTTAAASSPASTCASASWSGTTMAAVSKSTASTPATT